MFKDRSKITVGWSHIIINIHQFQVIFSQLSGNLYITYCYDFDRKVTFHRKNKKNNVQLLTL